MLSSIVVQRFNASMKECKDLQTQGNDFTLNIAGTHGKKDLGQKRVPLSKKRGYSQINCTSFNLFEKHNIRLQQAEVKLQSLECSIQKKLHLDGSWHHLVQDVNELQFPSDYNIRTRSEPFAVITELGWIFSQHMIGQRRQNACHFAFIEDVNVAEKIQTWWDIETCASS